jgi:hypothetical protein
MAYEKNVTHIHAPGRPPIKATRPVTYYLANRISRVLPQLKALNEVHKSQADAASALGVEIGTVRNYISVLGWEWNNLRVYKPRRKRRAS